MTGYRFTNGESVDEWLDSLSPEDRDKAVDIINDMRQSRQPLNFLQVKIRMTAPRRTPANEVEAEILEQKSHRYPGGYPEEDEVKEAKPEDLPAYHTDPYFSPELWEARLTYVRPMPEKKKTVKPWMIIAGVFVVIILLAVFTNPSENKHKEVMSKAIVEYATEALEDYTKSQGGIMDMMGSVFSHFGGGVIEGWANQILDENVRYKNYGVCSECVGEFAGEEHVLSFGIFGQVFTFNKDDLAESLPL